MAKNDYENELTYFGVLMNRVLVDSGVYLFKPEYLIEGKIEKEDGEVYFTDSMDHEYLTIHNSETLNSDEDTAVGYIISDEELLDRFPTLSIPEAKIEYFDNIRNSVHLGFYLASEDKIVLMPIDLMAMHETLNSLENSGDSNVIKVSLSDIMPQNSKENGVSENSKDSLDAGISEFGGQEMVVMRPEIFKDLMKTKSYEELMEKLDKIKSDYESVKKHFGKVVDFDDTKKSTSITKERFFNQKVDGTHIVDIYNASFDAIDFNDEISAIKSVLVELGNIFGQLAIGFDEKKSIYPALIEVTQDYLYTMIDDLCNIMKLSDISIMKIKSKQFRKKEAKNINAVAKAYDEINKIFLLEDRSHEETKQELVIAFSEKEKVNPTFDYLSVYNQMTERIIGRDKQIGSILTSIDKMDMSVGSGKRYSALIAGTTGTGKTQTFNELKKAIPDRPVIIVDTNQLTQEGYVGGKIEKNILGALLTEAHSINNRGKKDNGTIVQSDIDLAESGIVVLDEIDKRAEKGTTDNVNCGAVVDQLLKFMDGTTYMAEVGKQNIPFDTSKLAIMASGAFQEYFDEKENENKKIGFGNDMQPEKIDEFKKYGEVKPEDLVKYGLDNQFIGRFQLVILYPPHTLESLIELETTVATSNLENERKYLDAKGVQLVFEEGYIEEAAKAAIKLKTGGRGLGNIISRCLANVGDEINRNPDVYKIVFLQKESVNEPEKVMLLKNDGGHVLMEDVLKSSQEAGKNSRRLTKISFNTDAMQYVTNYKSTLCKEESKEMTSISSSKTKVKQSNIN